MVSSSFWDNVRDMVRRRDLVVAVGALEEWLEQRIDGPRRNEIRDWLDELILHVGSVRALEIDARKGLIHSEQMGINLRQISTSILALISEIEQAAESIPPVSSPTPGPDSSRRPNQDSGFSSSSKRPELRAEAASSSATGSQFSQAILRIRDYCIGQRIKPPKTFISYAWGVPAHETWVEKQLAPDLQGAGIDVVLDIWHNGIGDSLPRFVDSIETCDFIVVVGTPAYRNKYDNKDPSRGSVVAAEVEVISNRLLGTEEQKKSVLPVLLDGDKAHSLPPLLHSRIFGDFRSPGSYSITTFDLIMKLFQLGRNHPLAELREALRG
jgi:TIR domain